MKLKFDEQPIWLGGSKCGSFFGYVLADDHGQITGLCVRSEVIGDPDVTFDANTADPVARLLMAAIAERFADELAAHAAQAPRRRFEAAFDRRLDDAKHARVSS